MQSAHGAPTSSNGVVVPRPSHAFVASSRHVPTYASAEVGDGTTSVIVLAGEMLHVAEPLLERSLHPTVITQAYFLSLKSALAHAEAMAFPVDLHDRDSLTKIISTCVGTKYTNRFGRLMIDLALDAVTTVMVDQNGRKEIDVKRYAKVEKLPGGELEESRVLKVSILSLPRSRVCARTLPLQCE